MAKRIRWADGDERANPYEYVPTEQLVKLLVAAGVDTVGGKPFVPTGHPLECIDRDELTRLRALAALNDKPTPTDQTPDTGGGWGWLLVVMVGHLIGALWLWLVKQR